MECWGPTDDEQRASFEVVDLSSLPNDEMHPTPSKWWSRRPCGCDHCAGDWRRIAAASVEVLELGIDPIDRGAIQRHAKRRLRSARDQVWLCSLFQSPILAAPGDERFTDGRQRTHAMRTAGVRWAVIYTKAGERGRTGGSGV
jgi:hypothetical protein